jgi:integrase
MRTKHLTEEQVEPLREAFRGHPLEPIITLALVTGLRRDELLSLKWQDVDLEKGELRVQHSKTESSTRMIPITLDVARLFTEHRSAQMKAQAGLTWVNLDLVFPDSAGERLCTHQLMQEFHEVLEQAGLPRISFHDLREACGQTLHKQQERRA